MKQLRAGVLIGLLAMTAGVFISEAKNPDAAKKAAAPTVAPAPEPVIAGLEIARPTGAYLGLELVNNNFVLSFYDDKKLKTAPDVARAWLRWPVNYQPNDERIVLSPGSDGTSLRSAKVIRPQHHFRLAIMLFVQGNDDPVEVYNVTFAPAK